MTFTDQHYTPEDITAANPAVVTLTAHGLSDGQRIEATRFYAYPVAVATGMEQLNNRTFVVQHATTDTFELYDVDGQPIDSTDYTAFSGVGSPQFTLTGPLLAYENEA